MQRRLMCTMVFVAAMLPAGAWAKLCGDQVDGQRVPCACGDVVVSDATLGDAPVAHSVCSGDGLIVRAQGTRRITVDLQGATLQGGEKGIGLLIAYGGPGGARIISSQGTGTIRGFRDGIFAHGRDTLGLLDRMEIVAPHRDGVRITAGDGYKIRNTEVREAGRDGFSLGGKRFRVRRTRALNVKHIGYMVMGQRGTLGARGAGVVSEGSGDAGFNLVGLGHRLIDCESLAAAKNGVQINGMNTLVQGCTLTGNLGDGITGVGENLHFADNQAMENDNDGINVHSHDVKDHGGNRGQGNLGRRHPGQAVQCKLGPRPCVR
jgi:hypothetical protein